MILGDTEIDEVDSNVVSLAVKELYVQCTIAREKQKVMLMLGQNTLECFLSLGHTIKANPRPQLIGKTSHLCHSHRGFHALAPIFSVLIEHALQ